MGSAPRDPQAGDGVRAPQAGSATAESTAAELFILAVSVLSIVNILLVALPLSKEVTRVIVVVDLFISVVLCVDFAVRFKRGGMHYFVKELGWLDLIGSLTFSGLRILRLFRMAKVTAALARKGVGRMVRDFRANLAEGALFIVMFFVVVVVEFGSAAEVVLERNAPGGNIHTGGDALWWAMVSITTVGYGDLYPVTGAGRVIGCIVVVTGIALLSILTGFLVETFLSPRRRRKRATTALTERAVAVAEVRRLIDEQEAALDILRRRIADLEPGP